MNLEAVISEIEALRAKNNKLWMGYVRLAFKFAPVEASKLHKEIRQIDAQVSALGQKLDEAWE
jgi:hypothetical protein